MMPLVELEDRELARLRTIEREVWPELVGKGLYAVADRDAYWLDIGTPDRYLKATADILSGAVESESGARLDGRGLALGDGCTIEGELIGPSSIGDNCTIAAGATVGPGAALGDGVEVAAGASIESSAVLDGCRIGSGALIHDAILAPCAVIGDQARVTECSIVGPRVTVAAGATVGGGEKLFAADV